MTTYNVSNEEYNVNFDLKLNSFHDFIESLKKSKEYYYDYCNLKNINIKDFDNEYIDNINILKGELLKYYILITNDYDNVEKYVIVDDTIKEIYNSVMNIPSIISRGRNFRRNENIVVSNINYLNRQKLLILVKDYVYICCQYDYSNIINNNIIHRDNLLNMYNNYNIIIKYVDSLSYETINIKNYSFLY